MTEKNIETKERLNNYVFGKDKTEGIVSIEVKDDTIFLFMRDGKVFEEAMTYWLLCNKKIDSSFSKLNGNNHYKYIRLFDTKQEFREFVKVARSRNDLYYCYNDVEAAMILNGFTLFKGMKVEDPLVLSFDIEASGLVRDKSSEVFMITNTLRRGDTVVSKDLFVVNDYSTPKNMLVDWCNYVREVNPDIINGHNIFGYDLDFMNHVAKKYGTKLNIGRDGSPATFGKKPRNYRVDGSQTWEYKNCNIFGRHVIDGMFLSVKYDIGRNYPSWKLKDIAEHEGLVKENRQFYDASKIRENWDNLQEREKIISYGEDDADDSANLYYLHIPSFFYLCQSLPRGFQTMINSASGSWLNGLFVRSYLQQGHSIPKTTEAEGFEGAISYGVPGTYSNCFKQDVASLYPSIMRQWNITDSKKDYLGVIPAVVEYFTLERLRNKKIAADTKDPYYKALEQSQKIVINSIYGFLGAPGLNFNSPENAALITRHGREILNKAIKWSTTHDIDYWRRFGELPKLIAKEKSEEILTQLKDEYQLFLKNNEKLPHHLVNCDTDSIMVCRNDQSYFTSEEREEFLVKMNDIYEDLIIWEDDGYYDRVVIVKAKNYILKEEGKEKLKIKGSSFNSSSKEPALCQLMLDICHDLIDDKPWKKTLDSYLEEVMDIKDMSRWANKKSVSEKLIEANDTNKQRVLAAIAHKEYQVGDKFYMFKVIDGERPQLVKGEEKRNKYTKRAYTELGLKKLPMQQFCQHKENLFCELCNPHLYYTKMIPNDIYRLVEDFDGNYDRDHYLGRIYKTLESLATVLDLSDIPKYNTKGGLEIFLDKFNNK